MKTHIKELEESLKFVDLHPSLEEVVVANGLDRTKLTVGLQMVDGRPDVSTREEIAMFDGTKGAIWVVPSIRAIFRGDKVPPPMPSEPPVAYMPLFHFIETHVLTYCDGVRDKTDREFEEVFSQLRRRPDGKSFSDLHHFLWQVAAGLAGIRPVSAAEFDAIFARLTQSARTFQIGPVSRNYISVHRDVRARANEASL